MLGDGKSNLCRWSDRQALVDSDHFAHAAHGEAVDRSRRNAVQDLPDVRPGKRGVDLLLLLSQEVPPLPFEDGSDQFDWVKPAGVGGEEGDLQQADLCLQVVHHLGAVVRRMIVL